MINLDQICKIVPAGKPEVLATFIEPLNRTFETYDISNRLRVCMFVAQAAHESMNFSRLREIWGPTPQQLRYERLLSAAWPPTAQDQRNKLAWQLGNANVGDGKKHMGRGIFMNTGVANNERSGKILGVDLLNHPELLEGAEIACHDAGLFWKLHGMNQSADSDDILTNTHVLNGGTNGLPERTIFYERAKKIIT